jgi:hypothetical protein
MSIGSGHPDVSGMSLARTIVLPSLLEGRMDPDHIDEMNRVFSLGLDAEVLADIEANVSLIRDRFAAFFDGQGNEWKARERFHVMTDFLEEVHDVPDHKKRVVEDQALELRWKFKRRMSEEMEYAPFEPRWERRNAWSVANRKVMKELGLWDGLGDVVEGKEALLKAFDATRHM